MKIGIVVRILWPAGTQKFAILQAKALTDAGHDVEVIFLRKTKNGNVYDDILKDLNYKVLTEENRSLLVPIYDWITGIFMSNRKGDGRVDYNLIRMFPNFAKNRYDLIICQDQWAGLAGYYTWKKYKTPYYVIIHERVNEFYWVKGIRRVLVWFALHYQKIILINAIKVLSETKKVAVSVNEMYSKYNIKCIYNFPGLLEKKITDYSEKLNTVSIIGNWNEVKFPEIYIDLFDSLTNYTFLMIGNWISESYRDYFISKLKERNVFERVKFISGLSETEKDQIISSSKFSVRFGKGEYGPGYGTIEALELGVPIIINRELGITDFLLTYECGLIVDNSSDIGIISSFITENDNPDRYKHLQSEIKRFIADHSWESHVKMLLE